MEDISLHIMDVAENAVRAGAENVNIRLKESIPAHTLTLEIEDDGPGMDPETLANAANPYFTTKEGKKYGLGLSLLSQSAGEAGGNMRVEESESGGVKITAIFKTDNVDMKPLGNIQKTLRALRAVNPGININFESIKE